MYLSSSLPIHVGARIPVALLTRLTRLAAMTMLLLFVGCIDANEPEPWPLLDAERFACKIQPILAKECSASACHGNPQRRMQVLAPGRMRLVGELMRASSEQSAADREAGYHPPLTQKELEFNLIQARGMVPTDGDWRDSPLLAFPLAMSDGGIYHEPNGDIFTSRHDEGYVLLAQWAAGLKGCQ